MTSYDPRDEYTIIHLPAQSPDWAGVLTQFILVQAEREGRLYATWAGERLSRAIETLDGVVALTERGKLLGMMLCGVVDDSAEMSFPWTVLRDRILGHNLMEATLSVIRREHPQTRYWRVERQILPGQVETGGVEAAGFSCHWRQRMQVDLPTWEEPVLLPAGYTFAPWHISYLDAAAELVYRANLGTLDARLYAPFFGDSPAQCRKGLLSILIGRYGPIHPEATVCALHGSNLAGINLVIEESSDLASVVELSVDPDHQRRGLGRALIVQSLMTLKEARTERVELAVTKANTRARQLYESLGFMESGEFPVCIPDDSAE